MNNVSPKVSKSDPDPNKKSPLLEENNIIKDVSKVMIIDHKLMVFASLHNRGLNATSLPLFFFTMRGSGIGFIYYENTTILNPTFLLIFLENFFEIQKVCQKAKSQVQ